MGTLGLSCAELGHQLITLSSWRHTQCQTRTTGTLQKPSGGQPAVNALRSSNIR